MTTNAGSCSTTGCSTLTVSRYSSGRRSLGRADFRMLVLIFAVMIPITTPAQNAGTFRLTDVRVIGSKRYETPEIIRATELKVGSTISPDELKYATEKLGSLGVFAQVSYRYATRGNSITAEFTVEDTPRLFPCTFGNFVWFSVQQLTDELRSQVPLFSGGVPAAGRMLDIISAHLAGMLAARGIQAQIQALPVQETMGGPIRSIDFRATGVSIPIRKIEFTGVEKVDAALLQAASRPLFDKDYDAAFVLGFSASSVANVYRERGYLRVQFGEPVARLLTGDAVPNAIAVSVPVTEGEQYRLREVTWSGDSTIPYGELAKSLHAVVGSPMDAVQLGQDVLALVLLFHPKGYLNADARAQEILDDSTRSGVFQIRIQQGQLFRLAKVNISGLDDAHAALVLSRSRLRPGDPYDSTYWDTFIQEIARLLPPSASGWRMKPVATIHSETNTVDVRLIFTEASSH